MVADVDTASINFAIEIFPALDKLNFILLPLSSNAVNAVGVAQLIPVAAVYELTAPAAWTGELPVT